MNTKVILLSDFDEHSWAIDDVLTGMIGCRVTWMTARNAGPNFLNSLSADILIIESSQLDLVEMLQLSRSTPVILLINGPHDSFAKINWPDNVLTLQKGLPESRIHEVFSAVNGQRLTRLGLRSSPPLSFGSRR